MASANQPKDWTMLMNLFASSRVILSEIQELNDLTTDHWSIPVFLTVDEVSQITNQPKDTIERYCAEGIYGAKKVDGEWRILSNHILAVSAGDMIHEAASLLLLASTILQQADVFPKLVSKVEQIILQIEEAMGMA